MCGDCLLLGMTRCLAFSLTFTRGWRPVGSSVQVSNEETLAAGHAADAKHGFRADYLHDDLPEEATQASQVRLR